jgi:hypothetical protein
MNRGKNCGGEALDLLKKRQKLIEGIQKRM